MFVLYVCMYLGNDQLELVFGWASSGGCGRRRFIRAGYRPFGLKKEIIDAKEEEKTRAVCVYVYVDRHGDIDY